MSGLVDALVIVAVALVVIARQFRASRIDSETPLVAPARDPGRRRAARARHTSMPHHHTASVLLLGAELLIGLATGAGWAWTTRIWVEPDGAVWSKSTKASGAVWGVGIGLRVGLFALGAAVGRSPGLLDPAAAPWRPRSSSAPESSTWRGQSLRPAADVGGAYGESTARPAGKERV